MPLKVKKADPTKELAAKIARALLTEGTGRVATRLVMKHPEGDFGASWSELGIEALVWRMLREDKLTQTKVK